MKRLYVDDGPGENIRYLRVEPKRRLTLTELERRWDAMRTSRQLAMLLLVVLALAALTEGVTQ